MVVRRRRMARPRYAGRLGLRVMPELHAQEDDSHYLVAKREGRWFKSRRPLAFRFTIRILDVISH